MDDDDDLHIRKRNRPSLVCDPCKRRKVKCDKGRPCTSCIKNNFTHKCVYAINWTVNKEKFEMIDHIRSARDPIGRVHPHGTKLSTLPSGNGSSNSEPMLLVSAKELNALKEKLNKLETTLGKISRKGEEVFSINSHNGAARDSIANHTGFFEAKYREEVILINKTTGGRAFNQTVCEQRFNKNNYVGELGRSLGSEVLQFDENIGVVNRETGFSKSSSVSSSTPSDRSTGSLNNYSHSSPDTSENVCNSGTLTEKPDRAAEHMIGVNPYASNDDAINFYENYISIHQNEPSRRTNYGPFTWESILRKDFALVILRKFTQNQKELLQPPRSTSTTESQMKFEKKELESEGVVDLLPYKNSNKRTTPAKRARADPHNYHHQRQQQHQQGGRTRFNRRVPQSKTSDTTPLLTMYEGNRLDTEFKLIAKIEAILPTQKSIWLLVKRFFLFVYPFMPFVDEMDFRDEMNKILGGEDYQDCKITKVNITKRMDFAFLGMLLIFLRLSYLTIASKHSAYRRVLKCDGEYLLQHPIETNVIEIAKQCINQFQIMNKCNFTIFQATYFLRMYHMFAPDEGDGADGGDLQVFNGMLIQMAYSMGLNRDPDNFKDGLFEKNEKVNNLGRKIWLHLVIGDFVNAYTFGTPLNTSAQYYDTKYPYHIPKVNENNNDTQLEKTVIGMMNNCSQLLIKGSLNSLLRLALDVNKKCKLSELTQHLNLLEKSCSKAFGKMSDYMTTLDDKDFGYKLGKFLGCRSLLSTKSFFLSMYYHLYLYYEEKQNSDLLLYYLKKMLSMSVGEIILYLFPFINGIYDFFEDAADVFIFPMLLQTIHRTSQINISAIVRINFHLFQMKTDRQHPYKLWNDAVYQKHFARVSQMLKDMEKCARLCIAAMSDLSDRYYYAWGAARSQTFLLKVVTSEEFYIKSIPQYADKLKHLSLGEIEELILLYSPSLQVAEDFVNKHCPNKVDILFKERKVHNNQSNSLELVEGSANATPLLFSVPPPPTVPLNICPPTFQHSISNAEKSTPAPDNTYLSGLQETPGMIRSFSNVIASEFEELNFSNSAEVDNLWLQMLSSKNENPVAASRESTFDNGYDLDFYLNNPSQSQNSGNVEGRNGRSGPSNLIDSFNICPPELNFENSSHFNFFSDLPLDKIFNSRE